MPGFRQQHSFWPTRIALLLSIGVVVPLGYWIRFAPAQEWAWLHDALGSVAYETFWILLVLLIWPQASITKTAVAVFVATCALEVLQLWQPSFLQALRATLVGRLVLGNTFSWADFPAYAVGSLVGYGWATLVAGRMKGEERGSRRLEQPDVRSLRYGERSRQSWQRHQGSSQQS